MTAKVKTITYLYCDYCKKRMMRRDAMNHHEQRCTMNWSRKCGMCSRPRDYLKSADEFAKVCNSRDKTESLRWLDGAVHCPACMLTVMRLSDVASQFTDIFQFREAMEKWNEERENADPRL